jgi:hypothetical protein
MPSSVGAIAAITIAVANSARIADTSRRGRSSASSRASAEPPNMSMAQSVTPPRSATA